FAPVLATDVDDLASGLKPTTMVRISLTNGTPIVTFGDAAAYDARDRIEYVGADAIAGEFPLRAEAAIPFAMVRAEYADLDASFTVVACLMSAAFLVLALQYVRRSQ